MMRIRMLTAVAGPRIAVKRGQETEMPDHEALRFIASGQAEPVTPEDKRATWELRISPEEYVRRFPPTAPNYERARELLGAP